jgi:hypothetical protein
LRSTLALAAAVPLLALLAAGVRVIEEDGFYYLEIAQNLVSRRGSTFDGIHPTNGYQPLWLALLVPVLHLASTTDGAIRLAVLVQAVLLVAAVQAIYALARSWCTPWASALAGAVWFALAWRVGLSGLEFALSSFLLLLAMLVSARRFSDAAVPSPCEYAWLGLLLALCALSRLDAVVLAILVAADLAWRLGRHAPPAGAARLLAALCLPLLALVGAYFAANVLAFGHPLPVSGLIKRDWSEHLLARDPLDLRYGWLAAKAAQVLRPLRHATDPTMASIVLGGYLPQALLAVHVLRQRGVATGLAARPMRALGPYVAFAALQPVAYAVLYHGHYSFAPWYYAAQPALAALLAAAVSDRLVRLARPSRLGQAAIPAAATLVLLLVGFETARLIATRREEGPLLVAAHWARRHLPADARIGAWSAGAIGFLSERQVVNLDGVVNTLAFHRREQYDLCGYWRRTGVTHLVDVFEAREGSKEMKGTTLPVSSFYAPCASELVPIWTERIAGNPGWPKAFLLRPAPPQKP